MLDIQITFFLFSYNKWWGIKYTIREKLKSSQFMKEIEKQLMILWLIS